MDEIKYYLCLEYKNIVKNQYGIFYLSFNQEHQLIYDQICLYPLKEIDEFLKKNSEEQIINQIKEDNIFYCLDENDPIHLNFSIRYQQNGKERIIDKLSQECLAFNIEEFLMNDLNETYMKIIYNNLGGYLNNPKISEEMKNWIKKMRNIIKEELVSSFQTLKYEDKRKITKIIYEITKNYRKIQS